MSDEHRIRIEDCERRIAALEESVREMLIHRNSSMVRHEGYITVHRGHGKFAVLNERGDMALDELMSKEDAEEVARELNAL